MSEFNRLEFIKSQRPVEPLRDWRVWILLVPIIISVFGFFVSGVFSFTFDAIQVIPVNVQNWLVIFGSALMVGGAEANTPGTFIEVYRKIFKGEKVTGWDYSAIALSAIGTIATLLIANAIRIMASPNFQNDAWWIQFVIIWMPLIAAFAVGCDYYGSLVETGSLFASYELRIDDWYNRIEQEQNLSTVDTSPNFQKQIDDLQSQVEYLQYPIAKLSDWRNVIANLNGKSSQYKEMNPFDAVTSLCRQSGYRFDGSTKTAYNWHKELI